jgi:hypothetical protein
MALPQSTNTKAKILRQSFQDWNTMLVAVDLAQLLGMTQLDERGPARLGP